MNDAEVLWGSERKREREGRKQEVSKKGREKRRLFSHSTLGMNFNKAIYSIHTWTSKQWSCVFLRDSLTASNGSTVYTVL